MTPLSSVIIGEIEIPPQTKPRKAEKVLAGDNRSGV
jgi:hypothetical protein